MKAMNNFVGANSVTELRAAQQYMSYLFYNLDFGVNAWKRSWNMEDNFINVGNVKGDTGQRFIISSDSSFWPLRAYDEFGRIVRLPSRLMTSNDALIQAPNIIAATAFEAFNEGVGRNLEGEDLTKYIKGTVDGNTLSSVGNPQSVTVTNDTTAPTVTSVSSDQTGGTYGIGTVIPIKVTFSAGVNVGGTPTLEASMEMISKWL